MCHDMYRKATICHKQNLHERDSCGYVDSIDNPHGGAVSPSSTVRRKRLRSVRKNQFFLFVFWFFFTLTTAGMSTV